MNSTPGRRPRSDATRNREAILRAALSALHESPRASMEEIAVTSGVSRGTLYSHFPSRCALVRAALHLVVSEANMTLTGLDDPALSPEDAVAALVATSWRVLSDMAGLWAAAGCELGQWELRRLHQDTTGRIRQLVMRGRRDGTFRTDQKVHWQIECIYAIARAGASLSRPEDPAPIDPTDAIVATVRTVLAAEPAASE